MIDTDDIYLRVCMSKLETARYDISSTRLLLRELRESLPDATPDAKNAIHRMIDDLTFDLNKVVGVMSILEGSITQHINGKQILAEFNERFCYND